MFSEGLLSPPVFYLSSAVAHIQRRFPTGMQILVIRNNTANL